MKTVDTVNLRQRKIDALLTLLQQNGERVPHQLATRFPHILERIAAAWPTPDKARSYLKNLMTVERDGRQGFPADVYAEIFAISNLYDRLYPPPTLSDDWSAYRR